MEEKFKIIIVDDHQLFADGMVRILEEENDFEVVGVSNNGVELHHLLNNHRPDLLILDIQMAGTNGLEICSEQKRTRPRTKIILISMFESANVISEGKKAGADGYIPKTTDADIVKTTIREVMAGKEVFIKPDQIRSKPDFGEGNNIFLLSKREKEIIGFTKRGCTAKATAEELNISQYTVETHRKNILKKLDINSLKELIAYAYEHNL